MIKRIMFIVLGISCWLIVAESFIIKKKPRVSVSALKEQCCDAFGQLLKTIPQLLKRMAQVQEFGINRIYELIEGDKQSVFANASKEELQQWLSVFSTFNRKVAAMEREVANHIVFLESLGKTDVPPVTKA